MLRRFEVKNFKNFNDWFIFDLSDTKSYEFNPECVESGIVAKALIYGPNGCGKTNLGHAIFDIKTHLTDDKIDDTYSNNYLNAALGADLAEFKYTFLFGDNKLEYAYGKKSVNKLVYETVMINGKEVVSLDRRKGSVARIDLTGAETLKTDLGDSDLSVVKYVKSNAALENTSTTNTFFLFNLFIEYMMIERTINSHNKISVNSLNVSDFILDPDSMLEGLSGLESFEAFLIEAGIKCKLTTLETNGTQRIAFAFGDEKIDFCSIASTGTLSLTELYIQLMLLRIKLKRAPRFDTNLRPFIFIDEFDAFYHHAISKLIVKSLRDYKCQAVLTTHNTSIMSNDLLRPDCYFIMSETDIKPMYRFTEKELRKAHNIEKMYKAGAFDG
ncbi:MAG: hypothetical protein DRP64_01025 [Verrucomicrobia bacterium]|nr:MAG: hypothetical protein DRP64_01025 [Verrucomicrobiota bacterium]